MEIVLLVTGTVTNDVPGPPKPGKQFLFSDDLVLERVDNRTPGNGLPQQPQDRRAGTHSGSVTVLRIAAPNDKYLPGGGELFEYEGTYALNAVTVGGQSVLQEGQVTARGVVLLRNGQAVPPGKRYAITGGTGAYATARGQSTQTDTPNHRKLDIVA